jgi:hypothetical protein
MEGILWDGNQNVKLETAIEPLVGKPGLLCRNGPMGYGVGQADRNAKIAKEAKLLHPAGDISLGFYF